MAREQRKFFLRQDERTITWVDKGNNVIVKDLARLLRFIPQSLYHYKGIQEEVYQTLLLVFSQTQGEL